MYQLNNKQEIQLLHQNKNYLILKVIQKREMKKLSLEGNSKLEKKNNKNYKMKIKDKVQLVIFFILNASN